MQLQDSVILITGGAKRIGQALALGMAKRGARVAFSYLSSAREARETQDRLEREGTQALAIRADVSKAADVKRMVDAVGRAWGRLDVLINSAATFDRTPFAGVTEADWDRAIDSNLKGPFLCALYASRLMRRHGRGKIINFADWAALRPYRDYLPYCVSKAGVIGLTKALARELAPQISVVAIAPGPILPPPGMSAAARRRAADRTLLKRWGSPQDIVRTAQFLIEGTDFMTGSVVFVDGGELLA